MNILNLVDYVVPVYYMPFPKFFLLFIIFSFVGWCCEVTYVGLFFEHKFINRGFLNGPLCPIYGCGGAVLLFLPQILYKTWIPLFFASMILCSAVEYFSSWVLEKMFHTLWWDYSHYKVNLNGRICLLNSVLFGVMGVVGIHFAIPLVLMFLNWLGDTVVQISSILIAVLLSVDLIITIRRLVDFNASMEKLKAFGESLKDHYGHEEWFRKETLLDMINSVRQHALTDKSKINSNIIERIEKIRGRNRNVERFMKRFPTLKSKHYRDEIDLYARHLKERLEKMNKN
ncbi:MAG: putative ABC transporter permease [Treponema sp.]|nr:putative ABC transporter permease [Treponema sp.]